MHHLGARAGQGEVAGGFCGGQVLVLPVCLPALVDEADSRIVLGRGGLAVTRAGLGHLHSGSHLHVGFRHGDRPCRRVGAQRDRSGIPRRRRCRSGAHRHDHFRASSDKGEAEHGGDDDPEACRGRDRMPAFDSAVLAGDEHPGAAGNYQELEDDAGEVAEPGRLDRRGCGPDDVADSAGDDIDSDDARVEHDTCPAHDPRGSTDSCNSEGELAPGRGKHGHAEEPVLSEVLPRDGEVDHGGGGAQGSERQHDHTALARAGIRGSRRPPTSILVARHAAIRDRTRCSRGRASRAVNAGR